MNSIPLPTEDGESYHHRAPAYYSGTQPISSLFRNLKQDDIILIVLIIVLLSEGHQCDYLLVGILIFVFLAGMDGNIFGF